MKPTRWRLVRVAAVISTIAIAAPLSTAGAATAPPAAPVAEQAATITGPVYITTAPTTFINNNNQVASGNTSSGDQSAP